MGFKLCAFSDEAGSSLSEQIAALKRNNIHFTEIRSVDGVNIAEISIEKARKYAEELKRNNIKVWSIGSPLGKIKITDDFEQHLDVVRHIIELAKVFEADKVRMFSFYVNDHDKDRGEVLLRLNKMVKLAHEHNIIFYHENEKDIYGDTARYVADILDNVKGIKCIFDTANYIQCRQDIDEAMDMLLERTDYIHVKDALYETGEVVPPGLGDGKIEKLLSKTSDKVLTVEPHLMVFAGYKGIDKHELKNRYVYESNDEAFDAAVNSLKKILVKLGYKDNGSEWIK